MNTHNTHVTRGRSYLPLRRPADTVLSQLSVELYQPPTYQNSAFESKGGLSLHLSLQVPSEEEEEEKRRRRRRRRAAALQEELPLRQCRFLGLGSLT